MDTFESMVLDHKETESPQELIANAFCDANLEVEIYPDPLDSVKIIVKTKYVEKARSILGNFGKEGVQWEIVMQKLQDEGTMELLRLREQIKKLVGNTAEVSYSVGSPVRVRVRTKDPEGVKSQLEDAFVFLPDYVLQAV